MLLSIVEQFCLKNLQSANNVKVFKSKLNTHYVNLTYDYVITFIVSFFFVVLSYHTMFNLLSFFICI